MIKTTFDGSALTGRAHSDWLRHVFVLIRAEGPNLWTGSDLLGWGQQ